MLATALIFILWDVLFTSLGVWSFNPQYILGFYISYLPLEEVLFFIVIPYASIFIYECIAAYISREWFPKAGHYLSGLAGLTLLLTAALNIDKMYTFTAFFSAGGLLLYLALIRAPFALTFLLGYVITLLPFMLINGILTALPVVSYNPTEMLNYRLFTIPVEDIFYGLSLILTTLLVYEALAPPTAKPSGKYGASKLVAE